MNDGAFEALADADRRLLLSQLAVASDREEPLSVPGDVVERVEQGADRQAVALRFHHVHLPKLTELGYVAWDQSTGTVRPGPAFDELEPLLAVVTDDEQAGD
jgi:hypothetical protein